MHVLVLCYVASTLCILLRQQCLQYRIAHANPSLASAEASSSHLWRTDSNIISQPCPFLATNAGSKSILWPSFDLGGCEGSGLVILGRWSSRGEGPGVRDGRLEGLGKSDEVDVVWGRIIGRLYRCLRALREVSMTLMMTMLFRRG